MNIKRFFLLSEGPSRDVVLHLTTGRIHNKNVSTHLIGSISKGTRLRTLADSNDGSPVVNTCCISFFFAHHFV